MQPLIAEFVKETEKDSKKEVKSCPKVVFTCLECSEDVTTDSIVKHDCIARGIHEFLKKRFTMSFTTNIE